MREDDVTQLAQLAEPLRSRVAALLRRAGGKVWIVSGRRSIQEQVDLRRQHCGPTYYDIWKRPSSQCNPPTAIPGRSQHQAGLAADLGGDLGLVARLAKQVGLHLPVRGEAWHVEADPRANVQALDLPSIDDLDPGDFWPFPGPSPGDIGDVVGDVAGAVEDALGKVLGAIVDPLIEGASRIALVSVLVAGGVALVVLGGVRGAQSRGGP